MQSGSRSSRLTSWLIRRLLELAPLLALTLLAGFTYWLLQQKISTEAKPPVPLAHKPDYTLMDFTIRSFDDKGTGRTQLSGVRMDFYPDDETTTIIKPVVKSRNLATGATSQTVANRGVSNRDGSEVQFFGHVLATREGYYVAPKAGQPGTQVPPLEISSEFLHVYANEERLRSHVPTVVTQGKSRMSADQIEASNYDGTVKLTGRAKLSLAPKTHTGQ